MKVTGPTGPAMPQSGARPARVGGGFALPGAASASAAAPAAAASALGGVGDVSALMALQGVEDATERRRRALRRGGGLLDRLDELKLALLSGEPQSGVLDRLARAVREARPDDPDPALSGLLDQIDLRAAVELAKAEAR